MAPKEVTLTQESSTYCASARELTLWVDPRKAGLKDIDTVKPENRKPNLFQSHLQS